MKRKILCQRKTSKIVENYQFPRFLLFSPPTVGPNYGFLVFCLGCMTESYAEKKPASNLFTYLFIRHLQPFESQTQFVPKTIVSSSSCCSHLIFSILTFLFLLRNKNSHNRPFPYPDFAQFGHIWLFPLPYHHIRARTRLSHFNKILSSLYFLFVSFFSFHISTSYFL